MSAKQEILKNSHLLNEVEINYYKKNYNSVYKQEISKAEQLLKSDEGKEFIEQLNGMTDYRPRKQDGEIVSRGLEQFLDSTKQRDMLVSVWILVNNPDESKAKELGINLKAPESFEKDVTSIVRKTRKAAVELNTKSPSPDEVDNFFSEKDQETPAEKLEKPSDEKASEEEPSSDNEEETKDDDIEEFPPKKDSEKEPEEEKEEPRKKEKDSKKGEDLVDTGDFPPPKRTIEKFEEYKKEKLAEIDNAFSSIKEPTREQRKAYDNAKSNLEKTLSDAKSKIMDKQRGYDVYPTRSSAMKASTKAQKIASDARRKVNDIVHKFERSKMPGRLERTGMRLKDTGRTIKGAAETAADRTQTQRDALKSAAAKGTEAASRGAAKAGEAAQRATSRVKENIAARAIEKYLGSQKRNEYVEHLRKGNSEEAEKIRQEGIKKAQEEKQGRQEQKRDSRYDRMRSKTQEENYILKRYISKINEEDSVDIKKQEALKIAKTDLGEKGAEDYMKKMKGSSEEKEEAIEMLKKAEEDEKKKKEKLGIETKEQNESVKRVLKSIMK